MKKVIYIALALSIVLNMFFIYDHMESAKKLNITWHSSIKKNTTSAILGSRIDPLNVETLNNSKANLHFLTTQFMNLQLLPEGGKIVSSNTLQKVFEVTNYEYKLIDKMENDLKSGKKLSNDDVGQLVKINEAWLKMSNTLQKETNEIDPFSPIFRHERWKSIIDDATSELTGLKLVPLPNSSSGS